MDKILILTILFLLFSYLLGSLNFAIILCKLCGYPDPRNQGSQNPGATNVLRVANKYLAGLVLLCDALKGFTPVFMASYLFNSNFYIACVGLAAVLGHMFPVFFKFKGGKGIATYIGVLFAFSTETALVFCFLWFLIAIITKYSSLASIYSVLTSVVVLIWLGHYSDIWPFIIMLVLIVAKHRENIRRLSAGNESKIKLT